MIVFSVMPRVVNAIANPAAKRRRVKISVWPQRRRRERPERLDEKVDPFLGRAGRSSYSSRVFSLRTQQEDI